MTGQTTMKALAVLVTLLGVVVMIAWYGFLEPPFLSYPELPFEPLGDAKPGEPVALRVVRCNTSSEEQVYLITHKLVRLDPPPGDVQATRPIILPAGAVSIQPGCHEETSKANPIPKDTQPGVYFVSGVAKVDGRWRTSAVRWTSLPFRVVEP